MNGWPKWSFATLLTLSSLYAAACWSLHAHGRAALPERMPAPATQQMPASIRAQLLAVEYGGPPSIPRLNPFNVIPAMLMAGRTDGSGDDRGLRLLGHASRIVSLRTPTVRGSFRRHLAEAARTIAISRHWSADQIANTMLAEAYFGRNARGIEQAALAYYGLPADQLRAEESLALVALMRGPAYYDPDCQRERFEARYLRVAEATGSKTPNIALDRASERMLRTANCDSATAHRAAGN